MVSLVEWTKDKVMCSVEWHNSLQSLLSPQLQTAFIKISRYSCLVLVEVNSLVLNLSILASAILATLQKTCSSLARPTRIILRGEGRACVVSAVGTYEVLTAGCLPLAIAASSAGDEKEEMFLSVEKKREDIKIKNLQKFRQHLPVILKMGKKS